MIYFDTIEKAIAGIKAHPICQEFVVLPNNYVVYYPPTYKFPNGATVNIGLNPLASLNRLYALIDKFWNLQTLQIAKE